MTRRFLRPHLVFSAGRPAPPAAGAPQALAPDAAARFRQAILPHLDAAHSFARYLARDPTAAEDIVQDAFVRAMRAFPSWRGDAPKAWLLAIVRNGYRDWARRHRARQEEPHADPEGPEPLPPAAIDHETPEIIVLRQREADALRHTIETLPEPFRETLVLRDLEDLSYKEIAALTSVPIGTVMSRLSRARQMLAALLLPAPGREREVGS